MYPAEPIRGVSTRDLCAAQTQWLAELISQQRSQTALAWRRAREEAGDEESGQQDDMGECERACRNPNSGGCNERVLSRVFFISVNCLLFASVMLTDTPASRGEAAFMNLAWILFYGGIATFIGVFCVGPGYVDQAPGYVSFLGKRRLVSEDWQSAQDSMPSRQEELLEVPPQAGRGEFEAVAVAIQKSKLFRNALFASVQFDSCSKEVKNILKALCLGFPLPGSVVEKPYSVVPYEGRSSMSQAIEKFPLPLLPLLVLIQRLEAQIWTQHRKDSGDVSINIQKPNEDVESDCDVNLHARLLNSSRQDDPRQDEMAGKPSKSQLSPLHLQLLARIIMHPRFCAECCHIRPVGARHCSICGHCIARFDHHCPLTATCIGARNHWLYLLLVTFEALLTAWAAVQCFRSLYPPHHPRLLANGWGGLFNALIREGDVVMTNLRSATKVKDPQDHLLPSIFMFVYHLAESLLTLDFTRFPKSISASPMLQNWSWCLHLVCVFICILLCVFTGSLAVFHLIMMIVGTTTYELNGRRRRKYPKATSTLQHNATNLIKDGGKDNYELSEVVEVKPSGDQIRARLESASNACDSALVVTHEHDSTSAESRTTSTLPQRSQDTDLAISHDCPKENATRSTKVDVADLYRSISNARIQAAAKSTGQGQSHHQTRPGQPHIEQISYQHDSDQEKESVDEDDSRRVDGGGASSRLLSREPVCTTDEPHSHPSCQARDKCICNQEDKIMELAFRMDPALKDFRELGHGFSHEGSSDSESYPSEDEEGLDESKLPDYSDFLKNVLKRQKKDFPNGIRLISRDSDGKFSSKSVIEHIKGTRIVAVVDPTESDDENRLVTQASVETFSYSDEIDAAISDEIAEYIHGSAHGVSPRSHAIASEPETQEYIEKVHNILIDSDQRGDVTTQARMILKLEQQYQRPSADQPVLSFEESPVCCASYRPVSRAVIRNPTTWIELKLEHLLQRARLPAIVDLLRFRLNELRQVFSKAAVGNVYNFFTAFRNEPVWLYPLYRPPSNVVTVMTKTPRSSTPTSHVHKLSHFITPTTLQ